MPSSRALRIWSWLHKWTSLVCTVFMLLLCLTGLPLIFHHEIADLLGTGAVVAEMPADTPRASLDTVMAVAIGRHPGKHGMFVSQEPDDDRVWYVTLSDTPTSETGLKQVAVDARTAQVLTEPPLDKGFLYIMRSLHVDLFAGLPGMLFLGFMGLLLLVSLVSGAVLYAPFMTKTAFGEIRRQRGRRIRWLDLHNLLGIALLVWLFVVGATGVINTGADLLLGYWQSDQLAEMVAPYKGKAPLAEPGSLENAVRAARAAEPGMKIGFVAFPGTSFSSPHHYGIFLRGKEALTARMLTPVLVDASTAQVTASRSLPWYLDVLLLSQPLHFGDYGGRPLQILWALLDLVAILVLGSGVYLWLAKRNRRSPAARAVAEEAGSQQGAPAPEPR